VGQNATLRALDADIHAGLLAAGLADTGTYTPPSPPGGAAFPVRVMRDDVQVDTFGETRPVRSTRIELVFLRADFTTGPHPRGTVVVDGATFVLEDLVEEDQSISRWAVR
jgi:hypothetical protein